MSCYIRDQAYEEDDDGEIVTHNGLDYEDEQEENLDAYDLNDGFIDDGGGPVDSDAEDPLKLDLESSARRVHSKLQAAKIRQEVEEMEEYAAALDAEQQKRKQQELANRLQEIKARTTTAQWPPPKLVATKQTKLTDLLSVSGNGTGNKSVALGSLATKTATSAQPLARTTITLDAARSFFAKPTASVASAAKKTTMTIIGKTPTVAAAKAKTLSPPVGPPSPSRMIDFDQGVTPKAKGSGSASNVLSRAPSITMTPPQGLRSMPIQLDFESHPRLKSTKAPPASFDDVKEITLDLRYAQLPIRVATEDVEIIPMDLEPEQRFEQQEQKPRHEQQEQDQQQQQQEQDYQWQEPERQDDDVPMITKEDKASVEQPRKPRTIIDDEKLVRVPGIPRVSAHYAPTALAHQDLFKYALLGEAGVGIFDVKQFENMLKASPLTQDEVADLFTQLSVGSHPGLASARPDLTNYWLIAQNWLTELSARHAPSSMSDDVIEQREAFFEEMAKQMNAIICLKPRYHMFRCVIIMHTKLLLPLLKNSDSLILRVQMRALDIPLNARPISSEAQFDVVTSQVDYLADIVFDGCEAAWNSSPVMTMNKKSKSNMTRQLKLLDHSGVVLKDYARQRAGLVPLVLPVVELMKPVLVHGVQVGVSGTIYVGPETRVMHLPGSSVQVAISCNLTPCSLETLRDDTRRSGEDREPKCALALTDQTCIIVSQHQLLMESDFLMDEIPDREKQQDLDQEELVTLEGLRLIDARENKELLIPCIKPLQEADCMDARTEILMITSRPPRIFVQLSEKDCHGLCKSCQNASSGKGDKLKSLKFEFLNANTAVVAQFHGGGETLFGLNSRLQRRCFDAADTTGRFSALDEVQDRAVNLGILQARCRSGFTMVYTPLEHKEKRDKAAKEGGFCARARVEANTCRRLLEHGNEGGFFLFGYEEMTPDESEVESEGMNVISFLLAIKVLPNYGLSYNWIRCSQA